jgi:hypothetical protein
LLVLSFAFVAVAFAFRFYGSRRRDRFFEQLRLA